MTLETIKEAITELPLGEKTRLAAWLLQQDREEWDRQIEEDFSPGGHGMALLEEAEADVREGRAKPMDEFLAEAKARRNPSQRLNRERLPILHHFALLKTVRGAPRRGARPDIREVRSQEHLYKSTSTDQYGQFTIRGVSPGDYKLFAWEKVEVGAYQDAEFLRPYEERSHEVHVEEGSQLSAQLDLIPADAQPQ